MALAYRSNTAQGQASGGALTVTKPTGTIDGDILVATVYLETDTNTWASVGSGFNLLRTTTNATKFRQDIYWKRASGEPASWTWTPTATAWRSVTMAAYSGNSGTGTPVDVSGSASGNGGTGADLAPTVTTTAANDLLLALCENFNSVNVTALTGAVTTLRNNFNGEAIGDATIAAAGATGTTSATVASNIDYAHTHVALLLTSSGAAGSDIPVPLNGLRLNTLIRM